MGIKNTFSIIVDDLNSPKWKNVRYDIVSNGMLLYSKFKSIPENLQHNVLITFSTNKLKQSDKMKLIRNLYGYESNETTKPGLVNKYNGIKISVNSVLIPIEKVKEFRKLFSEFRVTPQIKEIWIRE